MKRELFNGMPIKFDAIRIGNAIIDCVTIEELIEARGKYVFQTSNCFLAEEIDFVFRP